MTSISFDAVTRVDFDEKAVMAKIHGRKEKADFALGVRVLTDSNFYCKRDSKTLIRSSIVNSSRDLTTIHWVTPYAYMQYCLPAARRDLNPNATWKWFEVAKSAHLKSWIKSYKKALTEGY